MLAYVAARTIKHLGRTKVRGKLGGAGEEEEEKKAEGLQERRGSRDTKDDPHCC